MAVSSYGAATKTSRRRAHPQGPRPRPRGPRRAAGRGHRRLWPHAQLPAEEPAARASPRRSRWRRCSARRTSSRCRSTSATSGSTSRTSSWSGYGLDFAERFRNLPYIATLKPEAYGGLTRGEPSAAARTSEAAMTTARRSCCCSLAIARRLRQRHERGDRRHVGIRGPSSRRARSARSNRCGSSPCPDSPVARRLDAPSRRTATTVERRRYRLPTGRFAIPIEPGTYERRRRRRSRTSRSPSAGRVEVVGGAGAFTRRRSVRGHRHPVTSGRRPCGHPAVRAGATIADGLGRAAGPWRPAAGTSSGIPRSATAEPATNPRPRPKIAPHAHVLDRAGAGAVPARHLAREPASGGATSSRSRVPRRRSRTARSTTPSSSRATRRSRASSTDGSDVLAPLSRRSTRDELVDALQKAGVTYRRPIPRTPNALLGTLITVILPVAADRRASSCA